MEDLIRALCQRLIESDENSDEFRTIAAELQSALSKHIERIRGRLKHYPLAQETRFTGLDSITIAAANCRLGRRTFGPFEIKLSPDILSGKLLRHNWP